MCGLIGFSGSQNANMHTVEALIAAYEIFKEKIFLEKESLNKFILCLFKEN